MVFCLQETEFREDVLFVCVCFKQSQESCLPYHVESEQNITLRNSAVAVNKESAFASARVSGVGELLVKFSEDLVFSHSFVLLALSLAFSSSLKKKKRILKWKA